MLSAQYSVNCDQDGCTTTEIVQRVSAPGENIPVAVLPPGWYENHEGKTFCPGHADAARTVTLAIQRGEA